MAGPQPQLVFAPLGGVGEIGMNLSIYGLGPERDRKWLMVDLGVSFASEEHLPGVDLILPDIRYLIEERKNLAGLVLTHAHEDHFGAILDLWPQLKIPIYATPFTAALLAAKRASEPGAPEVPVKVVARGSRFNVGPFDIELVSMAHSIPESNALIIRTPARRGAAHRRLENRSDADPRRRHRREEAARAGRGRLSGAGRGFDQCRARGPLALGGRRRQDHRRTHQDGPRTRRRDHIRLQRRAPARGGRRRPRRRPRGGGRRPRHGARRPGRARDRLSRRRAAISGRSMPTATCRRTRWWRCAPAARASRARRFRASPRTSTRK